MEQDINEQLLATIRRLVTLDFEEDEMVELIEFVEKNVPDPNVYSYMLKHYVPGTTAEEILERALAYKPIQLPNGSN
ncbi:hypothetical protein G6L37_06760 [Agrobacterium rubi]|nr:hypothetical protein [Agrobacterium rubi]NTF25065.1 hypothetical protein [Agrobacterium rubi]